MRRKSLCLSIALLVFIVGTVVIGLAMLTQHEPAFYTRAAVTVGTHRFDLSNQCQGKTIGLSADITNGGSSENGKWFARLSEAELNSYFEEHFISSGLADKMLPDGVRDPRISLEQDRIRLGFRYGSFPWSTIISIDFRVWLAQAEPNVVVLEFRGLYAGALPISAQSLLEDITETLRRHRIQVSWYRHQGFPTAALKFQSDQPRPSAQLRQLEIKPGMLTIIGQSTEFMPNGGVPQVGPASPSGF